MNVYVGFFLFHLLFGDGGIGPFFSVAAPVVIVVIIVIFAERLLFLLAVVILELHRFETLMDLIHEVLPDRPGPGGSLKIIDGFRRVAADPYGSRVVVRKTAEPAVLGLVRGAGLAGGGHAVIELKSPAGSPALLENAFQNADHLSGRVCGIHRRFLRAGLVDHVSLVVLHVLNACGCAVAPVVFKRRVTGRHFNRFHAVCKSAQRRGLRHIRVHDPGESHLFKARESHLRCDVLIYLPRDGIEGPLHGLLERHLAAVSAARILGPVLDLFVLDFRVGVIAVVKRRRVDDQRFDGTAGLTVALESAVEREIRVRVLGPSADHCDHMSGAVVNADRGALHFPLSVLRLIREIRQRFVHLLLKQVLHFHVKRCIDLVPALVELRQAGVVHLVVAFLIGRPVLVAGKIIAQDKSLHLHQGFRRALIGISDHIVVAAKEPSLIAGEVQRDLLANGVIVRALRDLSVLQHVLEDQVPPCDRVVGIDDRVIVGRAVGDRAHIGSL